MRKVNTVLNITKQTPMLKDKSPTLMSKSKHQELKYVLVPGPVKSRDGDIHNVLGFELAFLYEVELSECVIVKNKEHQYFCSQKYHDLIWLYPREDGKYVEYLKSIEVLRSLGD